ncbi:MAG: hypothetical protein JXA98_05995 [Methanosarcinaceae archaeon]|nr:hypothetical protein [Methanosarcinaceae archaeon]
MDDKNKLKLLSCLEVFGVFLFVLVSIIGLGWYIPHLNNEISIQEQNILHNKGELDRIYRIEFMQRFSYSDLSDITNLYFFLLNDDLNNDTASFIVEMIEKRKLAEYQTLVFLASGYQGNITSFDYLKELDKEQLDEMLSELNYLNGQKKLDLEFLLTQETNAKMEIEEKRDFCLIIILILQTVSFIMTNSVEIYSHAKIIKGVNRANNDTSLPSQKPPKT